MLFRCNIGRSEKGDAVLTQASRDVGQECAFFFRENVLDDVDTVGTIDPLRVSRLAEIEVLEGQVSEETEPHTIVDDGLIIYVGAVQMANLRSHNGRPEPVSTSNLDDRVKAAQH